MTVRFLISADPQFENGNNTRNSIATSTLNSMLATLKLNQDIRGLLIAGDLTQNTRPNDELECYINALEDFIPRGANADPYVGHCLTYDGLGNHDLTDPDIWQKIACGFCLDTCVDPSRLIDFIGRDRETSPIMKNGMDYAWRWDCVVFVQLNLFPGHDNSLDFLQKVIREHVKQQDMIVIVHHYGFDTFSQRWWTEEQRAAYWDIIANTRILGIFTGHTHPTPSQRFQYDFCRPQGKYGPSRIPAFVAGGCFEGAYLDVTIKSQDMIVKRYDQKGNCYPPNIVVTPNASLALVTTRIVGRRRDFNANGKSDLCVWYPETGNWQVALSAGNRFLPQPVWLEPWAKGTNWVPFFGDFNADGRSDLCVWYPETGNWQVALSDGNRFLPQPVWLEPWAKGFYWVPLVGDFNGDGKDDLCVWDPATGNWQVALSDGKCFVPQPVWLEPWAKGTYGVPLVGDFNGDGKDDLCVWDPVTGNCQVALSDGKCFVPQPAWLQHWVNGPHLIPFVGDFNGDGKDDLCVWDPVAGTWLVALSDGRRFVPQPVWLEPWAKGTFWIPIVGDFNGDGKDDLCVWDPAAGNWQVALSDGSHFAPQPVWLEPWAKGKWVA